MKRILSLVLSVIMVIAIIPVSVFAISAADALATFTLGADGSASHYDGSAKKAYSETVNGYTLNVSSTTSSFYTGARDAKGNGCFKLGTSSKTSSFTFTVPDDVTSVVIHAGKYKSNTSKISINGGEAITLTKSSANGQYDEITVDTTTTKTITVETVSGGVRTMINTIVFYGTAGGSAEPACQHENASTADCTNPSVCPDCGETVEAATGHNYVDGVVITPPTCTTAGEQTIECSSCGDSKTKTIDVLEHNYVDGACSVCGEPMPTSVTLDFSDVANRVSQTTAQQVWAQNGITFTNDKASSTNAVADYTNPVRLYKGSSITVAYTVPFIKVVINCSESKYNFINNAADIVTDTGAVATVVTNDTTITITFDKAVNSFTVASLAQQTRFDSIEVHAVPATPDPVPAGTIKVTGYQQTLVNGGKYNVRFIAALGEFAQNQGKAGFEISTTSGKEWEKATYTFYETLTANYGTQTVSAADIGGTCATALAITGIPQSEGDVTFIVKPYVVIDGQKVYGEEVTVTVSPKTE